jgi:hypothetical protein
MRPSSTRLTIMLRQVDPQAYEELEAMIDSVTPDPEAP